MERLNSFSELNRKRLFKKLNSAKNKASFRSTVSEIRFGEFFQELNFEIEYDRKIENLTPDWALNFSSFPMICDVYRLGQSDKDQLRSDFENSLKQRLEQIQSNYIIDVRIKDNFKEYEHVDINDIYTELTLWLITKPIVNDYIFLHDNFYFRIRGMSTKLQFASFLFSNSIDYKIGKLRQFENNRPNEITKKIHRYSDLIALHKLPYFICVDIDFISGFSHEEFEEYFLGSSAAYLEFNPNNLASTDIGTLGSEWTILGEFYNNKQISGIITCLSNEYKVLLNPIMEQVIYEKRFENCLKKLIEHSYVR